jgi:hypothetical protein
MNNVHKYIGEWPCGHNGWITLESGDYRIPPNGAENVAGFISWNSNVCVIYVNQDKGFIHMAMLNLSGFDIPDMICGGIINDFFGKTRLVFAEVPIPRFLKGRVMPSRHFRASIKEPEKPERFPWKEYFQPYPDIDDDYDQYLMERMRREQEDREFDDWPYSTDP